jgi:hypothetical protein
MIDCTVDAVVVLSYYSVSPARWSETGQLLMTDRRREAESGVGDAPLLLEGSTVGCRGRFMVYILLLMLLLLVRVVSRGGNVLYRETEHARRLEYDEGLSSRALGQLYGSNELTISSPWVCNISFSASKG